MKVGIFLSLQAPAEFGARIEQVYEDALDLVVEADRLGLAQAWLTEHHFEDDGYCPSPMIAAATIVGRTERIRVGHAVLVAPFYGHPLRLAEDAAVLDVASGGRLDLGIGQGYRVSEFDGYGVDYAARRAITEETLDILDLAWRGERFSYTGENFQLTNARLRPLPVQRPGPPIWMGATVPAGIARVAKRRLPLLISLLSNIRTTRRLFDDYDVALGAQGLDPAAFPKALIREFYVAESAEQAWQEVRPYFLYVHRSTYGPAVTAYAVRGADGSSRRIVDPDDPFYESSEFRADRFIIGDPESCAREIVRYRDTLGLDQLVLRMQFPGQPRDQAMTSLKLLVNEVLPIVEQTPRGPVDDGAGR